MLKTLSLFTVLMIILAACGGTTASGTPAANTPASSNSSGGAGDPAKLVEKYLQAKISTDEQTIRSLLCAAMEKDLQQEATTFLGTSGAQLEGVTCKADGADKVTCQGKIVAQYGQEKNEFPLVSYKVVQEAGEWKYCGETN